jgi:hypothetical protein
MNQENENKYNAHLTRSFTEDYCPLTLKQFIALLIKMGIDP